MAWALRRELGGEQQRTERLENTSIRKVKVGSDEISGGAKKPLDPKMKRLKAFRRVDARCGVCSGEAEKEDQHRVFRLTETVFLQ